MTMQKYIGDSKMFEYDKFYRECQQLNKPFIKSKINTSHGNCYVQIDLMTCNYDLSQLQQEKMTTLIQNEIKFIKSNLEYSFNDFHIDKEVAWFDGVSTEHVHVFCESLYDLSQKQN
ncbi:MAG: hypothetical protein HOK63_03505 [Thaumarchaeota archaeon]|nr:hypothetical protein [Nitrososphaerota archaeon]